MVALRNPSSSRLTFHGVPAALGAILVTAMGPTSGWAHPTVAECAQRIAANPKTVKAELKLVTLAPAGSQWARAFQIWSDQIQTESDCEILFRWYWNGGGGDEARMVADVRQGQRHGAAMTALGLGEIDKDIMIFQMPGLFDSWQSLDAVRAREEAFFEAEFAKRGFVIVGWGDVGAAKVMSIGFGVERPEDLKNQVAFYLPGDPIAPVFFQKLGVKTNPIGIGEVGSRLGKDIRVLSLSPYAAEQLQLASRITDMTMMTPLFLTGALVMKKEKLDTLAPKHRELILRTGHARSSELNDLIRRLDGEALQRMKGTKKIHSPPPAALQSWEQIFEATRNALRGAPFTPALYDRIVAAARSQRKS